MPIFKPLSNDAIDTALAKAERYRFLNEPGEAESICLDILEIDPGNQPARITLLLALTDQFADSPGAHHQAKQALTGLAGEYEREYYAGIVAERRAKAQVAHGGAGASVSAFEWIAEAMHHFECAEALRSHGNDDAKLRWNACARFLERHPDLRPASDDPHEIDMLE